MALTGKHNERIAGTQYISLEKRYACQAHPGDPSHASNNSVRSGGWVGRQERRSLESVTGLLERIGCGYLVLNREKRVIEWDAAAQETLERQGETAETASELSVAVKRLVANVPVRFVPGSLLWIVIRSGGDRPAILNEMGVAAHDGTIIIALLDRENRSAANPLTLQRMFGLTSAETRLALRLAHGDAPLEIARSWRLSRTTIRSQLASLFAKTETKRQAELVALLGRISVLP